MAKNNNTAGQFKLTRVMKIALILSVLFHIVIVVVGMVGLPIFSKSRPLPQQAISIELLDVSEVATVDKKPIIKRPKRIIKKPDEPKKEKPPEKKVKAPPKVDAKTPPKIKPLDKPKEKKKDTVKPKSKVPPPPSEKLKKPEPPKKKTPVKKEEATTQEDDFESLMKNLQESESTPEEATPDAPLAPTMTQSELGALTQQLIGCWQIPIGAKDVHNMVVTLHIWPNDDRTVRRVEIQGQWNLQNNPAFRAVAESARTAVLHPDCSPLDLPMDKFDVWKDKYIAIDFDPSYVT